MKQDNYTQSTISDRLQQAIRYLRSQHLISNQKDLASKMGTTPITVSRALRGFYKGEKFARDLNSTFGLVFSDSWLLHGTGEMLSTPSQHRPVHHPSIIIPQAVAQQSQPDIPAWADSLIQLVSDNIAATESLRRQNIQLVSDLSSAISEIKRLRNDLTQVITELQHQKQTIRIIKPYGTDEDINLPSAAENQSL